MTKLKDQIHWSPEETSRGARLVVTADNKAALDTFHECRLVPYWWSARGRRSQNLDGAAARGAV